MPKAKTKAVKVKVPDLKPSKNPKGGVPSGPNTRPNIPPGPNSRPNFPPEPNV